MRAAGGNSGGRDWACREKQSRSGQTYQGQENIVRLLDRREDARGREDQNGRLGESRGAFTAFSFNFKRDLGSGQKGWK